MTQRANHIVLVCAVLLSVFLGGGRDLWAMALVLLLSAFCMLVWPCCHQPPKRWLYLGAGLVAWCCLGLWPTGLIYRPAWQRTLLETPNFSLSPCLSAQPWITLENCIMLAAGLLWFFYIASLPLGRHQRRSLLRMFSYGIFVLAGASVLFYMAGQQPGFWYSPKILGPFENRNQLACLMAMSSVVTLSLAVDHLRRREYRGWIFVAGLALQLVVLILSFSRAGVVLFFVGTGIWMLMAFHFSFRRPRTWVACSCFLLALAGFILFGGKTADRFTGVGGEKLEYGGRYGIQRDALDMILSQPVTGVGTGNFSGVFPFYRTHFKTEDFVRHPESDWLWLTAEAGIPATLLVLGLAVFVFRACFPFDSGSDRSLRSACLAAGCILAVHGLVDVSGHRLGTIWPALMLAGMALRVDIRQSPSRKYSILVSVSSFLLIVISLLWLSAAFGVSRIPCSATVGITAAKLEQNSRTGEYQDAKASADEAIAIMPLKWEFYFSRAVARLKSGERVEDAVADFRSARMLEKNSSKIPFQEGMLLLPYSTDYALAAWSEALHRCGHGMEERSIEELYYTMQGQSDKYPGLRENLALLARDIPRLEGYYWMSVPKEEGAGFLRKLLEDDENFQSEPEKEPDWLWKLWIHVRGLPDLEEYLRDKPAVNAQIWPILVDACEKKQEFEKAYYQLKKNLEDPAFPTFPESERNLLEAKKNLLRNPDDPASTFVVVRSSFKLKQPDEAIAQLQPWTDKPGIPRYFYYLLSEAYAMKEDWQKAYESLSRYRYYKAATGAVLERMDAPDGVERERHPAKKRKH